MFRNGLSLLSSSIDMIRCLRINVEMLTVGSLTIYRVRISVSMRIIRYSSADPKETILIFKVELKRISNFFIFCFCLFIKIYNNQSYVYTHTISSVANYMHPYNLLRNHFCAFLLRNWGISWQNYQVLLLGCWWFPPINSGKYYEWIADVAYNLQRCLKFDWTECQYCQ